MPPFWPPGSAALGVTGGAELRFSSVYFSGLPASLRKRGSSGAEERRCQCANWTALTQAALGAVPVCPPPAPTRSHPAAQGQGLSAKQMALCDSFVYIAQYGGGTASLNVTVATTICLHHFALWAGYQEHPRDGFKYIVGPKPQRTHSRGERTEQSEASFRVRVLVRRPAGLHPAVVCGSLRFGITI